MSARRSRRRPARPAAAPRRSSWRAAALAATALAGLAALVYGGTRLREPPQQAAAAPAVVYTYDVVGEYPHDPDAFTQGLIYRDGFLFESTGLNGRSSLRKVRLETGDVVQRRDVDARYFAEGLTDWGNRLVQLTYQTNVGFVYDLETFEPRGTFNYDGEGWGLARDDRRLIMSDGSSRLRFIDPETFREIRRLEVTDAGRPVDDLNELEFVHGSIYANVWYVERIAMIDPSDGRVTGWIDVSGLTSRMTPRPDVGGGAVPNGIAYDASADRLFVTGKLWPRLFEIRVRPQR